jgi:hypothetical protein
MQEGKLAVLALTARRESGVKMEDVVQRLIQCIDEHIHDYQKQWQQQREIWHTIASANEKNEVAKALVALASSYGVESRIHAQPHNGIYGAWGEQAAPVVFIYVPVRQPGKKYLAILATWLVAIASYQKVLGTLPIQIHYILVNGDKASGQQLADLYSQAQPQTHNHLGCIWYSEESIRASPPLFALGCKGILDVELRARTATEPLASTHGAVVPNALWRLAWAINALKNAQEEILIPGFYDDVQPEADQQIAVLHTLPMCLQQYIQAQGIAQPLLWVARISISLCPPVIANVFHQWSRGGWYRRGTTQITSTGTGTRAFSPRVSTRPRRYLQKITDVPSATGLFRYWDTKKHGQVATANAAP